MKIALQKVDRDILMYIIGQIDKAVQAQADPEDVHYWHTHALTLKQQVKAFFIEPTTGPVCYMLLRFIKHELEKGAKVDAKNFAMRSYIKTLETKLQRYYDEVFAE